MEGPGVLGRRQFSGRQARPGWRDWGAVCAGCAHRDFRRVEFMAAVPRKPAMASSRSAAICGWAGFAGLPSQERVVLGRALALPGIACPPARGRRCVRRRAANGVVVVLGADKSRRSVVPGRPKDDRTCR